MATLTLTDQHLIDILKEECKALSWPFFSDGDYDLNLFGIRSASRESNTFDDILGVAYYVGGRPCVELWPGTTDPGKPSLQQPQRPDGCAILVDGFYPGLWRLGMHKRSYKALVQHGQARVWRDNDRDSILDTEGPTSTDVSGINYHKAGANSALVDGWSAGCQVHKVAANFERAMSLAQQQVDQRGWSRFSYKLFDERKSPRLSALMCAYR